MIFLLISKVHRLFKLIIFQADLKYCASIPLNLENHERDKQHKYYVSLGDVLHRNNRRNGEEGVSQTNRNLSFHSESCLSVYKQSCLCKTATVSSTPV